MIEFDSFDLHNNADLEHLRFDLAAASLTLQFRHAEDWTLIKTAGRRVDLVFGGVSDLTVTSAKDYDPRAADTLHGVEQVGSTYHIDCGDVQLRFAAETMTLLEGG